MYPTCASSCAKVFIIIVQASGSPGLSSGDVLVVASAELPNRNVGPEEVDDLRPRRLSTVGGVDVGVGVGVAPTPASELVVVVLKVGCRRRMEACRRDGRVARHRTADRLNAFAQPEI